MLRWNAKPPNLEKRLVRQVAQAIGDFGLIEDGDKVMVCVSGGKDSYGLLDVLRMLQQRNGNRFELIAVNLDQSSRAFRPMCCPNTLTKVGVPFHIETQDTYSVVKEHIPKARPCAACAAACAGAFCTAWPTSWVPPRSPWATTATTCCRRSS